MTPRVECDARIYERQRDADKKREYGEKNCARISSLLPGQSLKPAKADCLLCLSVFVFMTTDQKDESRKNGRLASAKRRLANNQKNAAFSSKPKREFRTAITNKFDSIRQCSKTQ